MMYQCDGCGYISEEPGNCPDCQFRLQEICGNCGQIKADCECES